MALLSLVLRLLTLDPVPATYVAAWVLGVPERGDALARVAWRESRNRWVTEHPGDRWAARSAWRNAMRAGSIDPQHCPAHRSWRYMSTQGAHGQMAAFALRYLWRCADPRVLWVPIISAVATVRRATSQRCTRVARCRKWRGW